MKRCIICLLCILVLCGVCTPVYAASDVPSMMEVADTQIPMDIRQCLKNPLYYDEVSAALIRNADPANFLIIADHSDICISHYTLTPPELALEQKVTYYLLNPEDGNVFEAEVSEADVVTLIPIEKLEWPYISPHVIPLLRGRSSEIQLAGQHRTVTAIYSFTKSYQQTGGCVLPPPTVYAYGVVFFETEEGYFVRVYSGRKGENTRDMTLAEYQQWAEAFCDYADFYNSLQYYDYTNRALDQFSELLMEYETVENYYAYVPPIRQAHKAQNARDLAVLICVAVVAVSLVALLIWRRAVNRKKYHM